MVRLARQYWVRMITKETIGTMKQITTRKGEVMSLKEYWEHKNQIADEIRESGRVWYTQVGKRLHVTCPESQDFIVGAVKLGGRYRHRSGVWSFPISRQLKVRSLAQRCFTR
jgi:hypothetical protein